MYLHKNPCLNDYMINNTLKYTNMNINSINLFMYLCIYYDLNRHAQIQYL